MSASLLSDHTGAWLGLLAASLLLATVAVGMYLRERQRSLALAVELDRVSREESPQLARDHVTGLLTRSGFDAVLDQWVQKVERSGGAFCVLYVSLDNFFMLNDAFGNDFADGLLKDVSSRLAAFTSADTEVCSLAPGEFALAVNGAMTVGRAAANRVSHVFAERFAVDLIQTPLTCSIGIAMYPAHGSRAMLLGHAALAMRSVRLHGGGRLLPIRSQDGCRRARASHLGQRAAQRAGARGLRMRVAVNISGYQMREDDLVDRIEAALLRNNIKPGRFTCEITESVAMEDTKVTQLTFDKMRQAGFHVSIDDFGTGYSSLASLRRLPAAELKIDRAFITDLEQSEDARSIAKSIINMATALNLRVVAEGVETVGQCELLVSMGCNELQGYLFSMPITANELERLALDDHRHENVEFRESLFAETRSAELDGDLQPLPRDF